MYLSLVLFSLLAAVELPVQAIKAVDLEMTDWENANAGWDRADMSCRADGRQLCTAEQYCQNDAPVGGTIKGDWFAAVADKRGKFVYVGDAYSDRLCKTFEPGWGQESNSIAQMRCCGQVDHAAQRQFLAELQASMPSARVYKGSEVHLRDYKAVLEHMQYFKRRKLTPSNLIEMKKMFPLHDGAYLGQEIDEGGFNNIRQGFEHMVLYSLLSGRTMLIPPARSWYFPPVPQDRIAAKGRAGRAPSLVQISATSLRKSNTASTSPHLGEFFDLDDLCGNGSPLRCATPSDFIRSSVGGALLQQRDDGLSSNSKRSNSSSRWEEAGMTYNKFVNMLRPLSPPAPVSQPLRQVLAWPSEKAVMKNLPPTAKFLDNRKIVEFNKEQLETPVLHFPTTGEGGSRYLGQVAAAVAFDTYGQTVNVHRFFHDRIHYKPNTFEIAARVVAHLGLFQYSSMHVRRGDLQYKEVFIPISRIARNTDALFLSKEPLYIATDTPASMNELSTDGRNVYRWEDFFNEKGGNVLKGVQVDAKTVGQVEQLICACGRVFVGTKYSTFSGYIPRLRGYMGAPDTSTYFNTDRHFGPSTDKTDVIGTEYMIEFPTMYEDI